MNTTIDEVLIGFDSAWADNPKAPGALCIARFAKRTLVDWTEPTLVNFAQAEAMIRRELADDRFCLIALDQPTIVPNDTGCRPVERVAGSLISRLGGGVQPASQKKAEFFGPDAPVSRFVRSLRPNEAPPTVADTANGLHMIEVFPALSLPALVPAILERKKAAKYNPALRNKFSLDDWKLVTSSVVAWAEHFELSPLQRWAEQQAADHRPTKASQDKLDSALCLLFGMLLRRGGPLASAMIGDLATGYMVTPISPQTSAILKAAAAERGVSFAVLREAMGDSMPVVLPIASPARASTLPTALINLPQPRALPAAPAAKTQVRTTVTKPSSGKIVFEKARLREHLIGFARQGKTTTYGDVARAFSCAPSQATAAAIVRVLDQLADDNRAAGEPMLMALVVNKETGVPGNGFWQSLGMANASIEEKRRRLAKVTSELRVFPWPAS